MALDVMEMTQKYNHIIMAEGEQVDLEMRPKKLQ